MSIPARALILICFLASALIPVTVVAYPYQAEHCNRGSITDQGASYPHGLSSAGSIAQGGLSLLIDGVKMNPQDTEVKTLTVNQNYTFRLEVDSGTFKGFLIRLEGPNGENVGAAFVGDYPGTNDFKVHPSCATKISAVTHVSNARKVYVEFPFSLAQSVENLRLDVTVVTTAVNLWNYSLFELKTSSPPVPLPSPGPSVIASSKPSPGPSLNLSTNPSHSPSKSFTSHPSPVPSLSLSLNPSQAPSRMASSNPSLAPSQSFSSNPSSAPNRMASSDPSQAPNRMASSGPSIAPSGMASSDPSQAPSEMAISNPNQAPSRTSPSQAPSRITSSNPSEAPSRMASLNPSPPPSRVASPSLAPSQMASSNPSQAPSQMASSNPSQALSQIASSNPSQDPSRMTSSNPSQIPSRIASLNPSPSPSRMGSFNPSQAPSRLSVLPSVSNIPSESCVAVSIQINPDEYTYETSWKLTDPSGILIVSAGTNSSESEEIFMDLMPYSLYRYDTCLPFFCDGNDRLHEYKLETFYYNGDGLILENAALDAEYYSIFVDGIRIFGDSDESNFGDNDTIVFPSCPEDKAPVSALSPRPSNLQSSQPSYIIPQPPFIPTISPIEQDVSSAIKPNRPSLITHLFLPLVLVLRGILK